MWLRRLVLAAFTIVAGYEILLWTQARFDLWSDGYSPQTIAADNQAFYTGQWFAVIACVFFAIRILWFLWATRHVGNTYRERRIVYAFAGASVLLLPSLIVNSLGSLYGARLELFVSSFDLRYLQLALPIAIAVVMIRFQAFHSGSYRLLTVVFLIAVSGFEASVVVAFFAMSLSRVPDVAIPFIPILGALLATNVFCTFQSSWRGWIGRQFFRERHIDNAMRLFTERLLSERPDNEKVGQTIADVLREQFNLQYVGVWLPIETPQTSQVMEQVLRRSGSSGDCGARLPVDLHLDSVGVSEIQACKTIRLGEANNAPVCLHDFLGQTDLEVAVPVVFSDVLVTLLILGRRRDQEILDEHHLDMSTLVGQQVALYTQTLRQRQHLSDTRRAIHSGPLAELALAGSILTQISQRPDSDNSRQLLKMVKIALEVVARELRLVNDGHYSHTLRDITLFLDSVRSHSLVTVQESINSELPLTETVENNLYWWSREAVSNTLLHGEAETIWVSLSKEVLSAHGEMVILSIRDDGIGMSVHQNTNGRARRGGLDRIKDEVEHLGGRLTIESRSGQGTTLTICLPVGT